MDNHDFETVSDNYSATTDSAETGLHSNVMQYYDSPIEQCNTFTKPDSVIPPLELTDIGKPASSAEGTSEPQKMSSQEAAKIVQGVVDLTTDKKAQHAIETVMQQAFESGGLSATKDAQIALNKVLSKMTPPLLLSDGDCHIKSILGKGYDLVDLSTGKRMGHTEFLLKQPEGVKENPQKNSTESKIADKTENRPEKNELEQIKAPAADDYKPESLRASNYEKLGSLIKDVTREGVPKTEKDFQLLDKVFSEAFRRDGDSGVEKLVSEFNKQSTNLQLEPIATDPRIKDQAGAHSYAMVDKATGKPQVKVHFSYAGAEEPAKRSQDGRPETTERKQDELGTPADNTVRKQDGLNGRTETTGRKQDGLGTPADNTVRKQDGLNGRPETTGRKQDGLGTPADNTVRKQDGLNGRTETTGRKQDGLGTPADNTVRKQDGLNGRPETTGRKQDGLGTPADNTVRKQDGLNGRTETTGRKQDGLGTPADNTVRKQDGLNGRPETTERKSDSKGTEKSDLPEKIRQELAILDKQLMNDGAGSLNENLSADLTALQSNNSALVAKHLGAARHADGNPGVSAYVEALNEKLKQSGSTVQVQLGAMSRSMFAKPGANGNFRIQEKDKAPSEFISY